TTTVAPAAANARAPARPMPEAAPVTIATLPFRSDMGTRGGRGGGTPPALGSPGALEFLLAFFPALLLAVGVVLTERRHREELGLLRELAEIVVRVERLGRRLELGDRIGNHDCLEGLLAEGHLRVHIERLVRALVGGLAVRRALGHAIAVEPGE